MILVEARGHGEPSASAGVITVEATAWASAAFDFWQFDERVDAAAARGVARVLVVETSAADASSSRAAVEVATRCQRHAGRANARTHSSAFQKLLAAHAKLYASTLPLVVADRRHTLDVWQWVLRLEPEADAVLQAAALFHDVERLASEAHARIEHHAPDYQAFKDAHARSGAAVAWRVAAECGFTDADCARLAALVGTHERTDRDPATRTLNDADALSFFALNSDGFARYFPEAHTRRKVDYSYARLSPSTRPWLGTMRLPALVATRLSELGATLRAPSFDRNSAHSEADASTRREETSCASSSSA